MLCWKPCDSWFHYNKWYIAYFSETPNFFDTWKNSSFICISVHTEQPIFFCKSLQNLEASEGETALLTCELSKPGVSVQWKKGTALLKLGKKYEMKQNGCELHLKIFDLKCQDSGVYKCCAAGIETTASVAIKGIFVHIFLLKNK